MKNNSGTGKDAIVPAEIDQWNWAFFSLSYVADWRYNLLPTEIGKNVRLIYMIHTFCPIILARKGNAILWRFKKWESVEEFLNHQAVESRVGKAYFFLCLFFIFSPVIVILIAYFIYKIFM